MPKITDQPLKIIQLRVFDADYRRAVELFGPNIGVNEAWRTAIHAFMVQTDDRIRVAIDRVEAEAEAEVQ